MRLFETRCTASQVKVKTDNVWFDGGHVFVSLEAKGRDK